MTTLNFAATINAVKQKVWNILWNDDTYRKWTTAFCQGSYAVSDWNEGSEIRFLDSNNNGMFSKIEKKISNEQMTFKHLGEIKNGAIELKPWGDAFENYFLEETNGVTDLKVIITMEANADFENYFNATFPKALAILKQLSEQ